MKTLFPIACLAAFLCFTTSAYSGYGNYGTGFYISGNVGFGLPSDASWSDAYDDTFHGSADSDVGLALGAAAGWNFGVWRLEGELAYQQNDFDTGNISFNDNRYSVRGDTSVWAGLVNAYYDFHNSTRFTPFIGGGIGLASIDLNSLGFDDSDSVFAWQVGGGVSYAISDQLNLDVKYRYFKTENPEFDGLDFEYESNNFYAGLRYQF